MVYPHSLVHRGPVCIWKPNLLSVLGDHSNRRCEGQTSHHLSTAMTNGTDYVVYNSTSYCPSNPSPHTQAYTCTAYSIVAVFLLGVTAIPLHHVVKQLSPPIPGSTLEAVEAAILCADIHAYSKNSTMSHLRFTLLCRAVKVPSLCPMCAHWADVLQPTMSPVQCCHSWRHGVTRWDHSAGANTCTHKACITCLVRTYNTYLRTYVKFI